ncbi:partial [Paramuricea clavata]|uniref:Partial n=1 Tax=Paramuricea clavata TaxID=317549 RepID=A0A6S7J5B5_PARCT|nr:partial [Paramuricea clavata]
MAQTISTSKKELEAIFDAKFNSISNTVVEMNDLMKFFNTSFEEVKIKVSNLENKIDEVTKENDFLKQESLKLSKENAKLVNVTNILSKEINDIQQYQQRDCCEITGLLVLPGENTNELVKKVGSLMDLELTDEDISVSHRLPKNEASYSSRLSDGSRKKLAGKTTKALILAEY